MKVSTTPNHAPKATEGQGEDYTVGQNEQTDQATDVFVKNTQESSSPKAAETPELTDEEEFVAYFAGGPGLSAEQFQDVVIPGAIKIDNDAKEAGIDRDANFYNLLLKNYHDYKDNVQTSIHKLEELMELFPEVSEIYKQVILDRQEAFAKLDNEITIVTDMKQVILDNNTLEEQTLLPQYLKEYHKWKVAYDTDGEYNGAPATLENKPNPFDFNIDPNGDSRIGDTKFFIAHKDAIDKDGKKVTIYDVINIDTKRPITTNALGEVLEIGSDLGPDHSVELTKGNLKMLSFEDGEMLAQLASEDIHCSANGISDAAIGIHIPEYMRVDKETNKAVGFVYESGKIRQMNMAELEEAGINVENTYLAKIPKVKVESVKSTSTEDGWDTVVKILGTENPHTPILKIQIKGTDNISASKRAIAIIAANESNPANSRLSGLNLDAATLKAEAEYYMQDESFNQLKTEYGIDDSPAESGKFNASLSNLRNSNTNTGTFFEGFKSGGFIGSNGHDHLFMEEAPTDYKNDYQTGLMGEEILPPGYTTSADLRGGTNSIFHKRGNVVANQVGFFWGGTDDDLICLNVPKNESVYIEARNEFGRTEIGNMNDDPTWATMGEDDDYYGISSADCAFANWYEPEVYSTYGIDAGVPEKPTGENAVDNANQEDFTGVQVADRSDISERTNTQISEHYKFLMTIGVDIVDQFLYDPESMEGVSLPTPALEMEQEMDTFFAGWSEWTGNFSTDVVAPGFDTDPAQQTDPLYGEEG